MSVPVIRLHPTIQEALATFADAGAEAWLRDAVTKAWNSVMPAEHYIDYIDLVTDGPTAQTTPLFAPGGVVLRLDLSCQIGLDPTEDEETAAQLTALIYHELYHVRDRLDPAFAFDYHEEAVAEYRKIRYHLNLVWDWYIERRKIKAHGVPPFHAFEVGIANKALDPRSAIFESALRVAPQDRVALAALFARVFDGNEEYTHAQLLGLARELKGFAPELQAWGVAPG